MTPKSCRISIEESDYRKLHEHLYPGDGDEHGAVLHAGVSIIDGELRLLVRNVIPAKPGTDYVDGKIGYRALNPSFIHQQITYCRDNNLAYLAVHNHDCDDRVGFSMIDLESHERGYPALLDIIRGMPVGALVLGRNSMQADIWLPSGQRLELDSCRIVGSQMRTVYPSPKLSTDFSEMFDRQIRMFGKAGQDILEESNVCVIGLGGIGSIIAEYLARVGVGHLTLVDPDQIEESNLSRVVGANSLDAANETKKVDIAARHIREANSKCVLTLIDDDTAKASIARRLRGCDFIFLAADSMRARLIFNALVHQYLIPGTQVGAKIRGNEQGVLEDAMSVVRQVRPGHGCLWCNQLIDPVQLAIEAKSDDERKAQAYGTHEPNPSVITLNAVAAAHATNDFLFDYLNLREDVSEASFSNFHYMHNRPTKVVPRSDPECRECGRKSGRYAMGDAYELPSISG